jgi:glycosyltransferase involved in cell wall biosynthesis
MKRSRLAIILPCYNPGDQWEQLVIHKFKSLQQKLDSKFELILSVVNDGSIQNLTKEIQNLQAAIPNFLYIESDKNKGKGSAIRLGLLDLDAEYFVYTDVDFPYTESSFVRLVQTLDSNDICLGIRSPEYNKNLPPPRRWISTFLKSLIKLFFNLKTSDTQAGLKGFNKKGRSLFMETKTDRFLVDLEYIMLISKRKDIKSSLVPIDLREDIEFSSFDYKILLAEFKSFIKLVFS